MHTSSALDIDLRHDVLDALEWADEVGGDVGVVVVHGVVTLSGLVDQPGDVLVVERVTLRVPGVLKVENNVQVAPPVH